MDEKRKVVLESVIKAFEGFILAVLGVIFIIFCNNEQLYYAVTYCVATVLLVFGLFSMCLSFLLGKGLLNADIVSGALLSGIGITLYVRPNTLKETLPLIVGCTIFFILLAFIVEIILCFKNKQKLRGILYIICAVLLLGFALTIVILDAINDENNNENLDQKIIMITIGITFIITGISYTVFSILKLVKKENKEIEKSNKKEEKNNKRNKKKNKENYENIEQIEQKNPSDKSDGNDDNKDGEIVDLSEEKD